MQLGAALHSIDPQLMRRAAALGERLSGKLTGQNLSILSDLVKRVTVHDSGIEIELDGAALTVSLGLTTTPGQPIRLEEAVRLTRTGRAMRLIHSDGRRAAAEPDLSILRMVDQGRSWWKMLAEGEIDLPTLAQRERVTASWMVRIVRLAFLAPEIVEMLARGRKSTASS